MLCTRICLLNGLASSACCSLIKCSKGVQSTTLKFSAPSSSFCQWSPPSVPTSRCYSATPYPSQRDQVRPKRGPTRMDRVKANVNNLFKTVLTFKALPSNSFDKDNVLIRHDQDNALAEDWLLIYDDRAAAVFHACSSIALPVVWISVMVFALDYWHSEGRVNIGCFQQMADNFYELGYFSYVMGTLVGLSCICVSRLQNMRLLRIYMNRQDPDRLRVLHARAVVFRTWVELNRSRIEGVAETMYDSKTIFKPFFYGNVRIGNRILLLNDNAFVGNNYRSFMLGETNRVPKDLRSIGLYDDVAPTAKDEAEEDVFTRKRMDQSKIS